MNKTALLLAAALMTATAAQAADITDIARYSDSTIALSDMPCPTTPYLRTAIHNAYGREPGTSYGCWTTSGGVVMIHWYRVANRQALPESVPKLDFEHVSN